MMFINYLSYKFKIKQLSMVIICIIILSTFSSVFSSQNLVNKHNIVHLTDTTGKYSLGKYVCYYEDQTGELTIDDIRSPHYETKFIQSSEDTLNFGFSRATYWIHGQVNYTGKNTIPKLWLLEIAYPLLDNIELYTIDHEGRITARKAGDHFGFSQREISYNKFVFKLSIDPKNHYLDFYLKIKTDSSVQIPLFLWSTQKFTEHVIIERFCFGLFFGTVLIMIIYNFFLFFIIRSTLIFYYLMFICSGFMAFASLTGYGFQYFWFNSPWWANKSMPFFLMMLIVFGYIFSQKLLLLYKYAPYINKLIIFFLSIGMIFIPLTLFIQYIHSIFISTISIITWSILLTIAGIVSFINGNHTARFYFLAWLLLLVGVFIFSIKSLGILPANYMTDYGIYIGSFNLVMLLSIAIVDQVNHDRKVFAENQKESIEFTNQLLQQQKKIHQTQIRIAKNIQEHADKTQVESNLLGENLKSLTVQSETVAATAEEISMSIVNISDAIKKMEQSVENVLVDAKKLFTNMNTVFQSIDTMMKSMSLVEKNARQGSTIANHATELSAKTNQTMSDLEIAANEIGIVTNVIKQISDKANLLSLNTAVEAAAAGISGRGFAVVSRFIQKFAEKSTIAATDIEHRIVDIQKKTHDTITVIDDVKEIIVSINSSSENIFTSIEKQMEKANSIASKAIDVRKKAKKILSRIDHLVANVRQIALNSNEISEGSNDVAKMMKHVSLALENCKQGIDLVSLSSKALSDLSNNMTGEHDK